MHLKDWNRHRPESLVESILSLDGGGTPQVAAHDFLRHAGESLEASSAAILAPDVSDPSAFRCLCRWGAGDGSPDPEHLAPSSPVPEILRQVLREGKPVSRDGVRLDPSGPGGFSVHASPTGSTSQPGILLFLSRPNAHLNGDSLRDIHLITGVAGLHLRALGLADLLQQEGILSRFGRKLSGRITSGASDLELFDFFSRFAGETFKADMVAVYVLSDDDQWIRMQSLHDPRRGVIHDGSEHLYVGDKPEMAAMVKAGRIIEIPDLAVSAIPEEWRQLSRRTRIGAILALPLPSAAGHSGFVVLGREGTGTLLNSVDRDLFQRLVNQAAPLLENSRMVRELRHNLDGLARLLETSREVSSQLELSQVPSLLARRAMEMTAADEGMIMLLDPDGRTLKPVLALSEYETEMMNIRCVIGEGIAGHVARTRIGEAVNRVDLDPRSRHIEGTPVEPEAMLCVPLICGGELLGVMSLYKLGDRRFSGTELATINIFATQAAIALENATLFQHMSAERSRLSTMIHQMEEAVFFCDATRSILVLNSSARALAHGAEVVLGKPLQDVVVDEMRPQLVAALNRLDAEELRNVTEEFRVQDSIHLGSFTAIRDEGHNVTGYIVLCKDVTELKSMESQLLQSSKMSAVGQLASGVAHEFNNLIAAIYGYAQFMKNSREERVLSKGIDVILSSSERARDLTQSLLTFSSATDDKFEAVDLNEVMSDAILLVEQQISKEGIRLVRETGRLPHAWIARGRLIEVFMNLISNARHAMPDGGTLTLATREEGDSLIVEVTDTGSGIPAENQGRVFDPFFTTKGPLNGTRTPGTGLGLFTVYNVIQAHGGQVTVDSARNRGTTIRISLPVRRSPVLETPPSRDRLAS